MNQAKLQFDKNTKLTITQRKGGMYEFEIEMNGSINHYYVKRDVLVTMAEILDLRYKEDDDDDDDY